MPKVRINGVCCFPKGTSKLDASIIQKNIRDCEQNLAEVKQEIRNIHTALLNLQVRQGNLEDTIRKEQDELFELYDNKIFRDTVGFNR